MNERSDFVQAWEVVWSEAVSLWSQIISVLNDFQIIDFIDIVLVAYLLFKAIKLIRETRAEQLIKGIALLAVSYLISDLLKLKTMSFLLKNVFQLGIIAIIVVFQPELRRALEKVGHTKLSGLSVFNSNPEHLDEQSRLWLKCIQIIGDTVQDLSKTVTGALIVIERQTKLGEQIGTGVTIEATPSVSLFKNIFFPNSPLHDGAVIMRDGIIFAASCFLPKPLKEDDIAHHLGSRHRAAIGMSEQSDAIVVVVSEETGTVSIAESGKLIRNLNKEELVLVLKQKLIPETTEEKKEKKERKEKEKKSSIGRVDK